MTSTELLLTGQGTPTERLEALRDVFTREHERMLQALDYADFLRTPYWHIIRRAILATRQRCATCGTTNRLDVHHVTYEHHGREHEHMSDLQLLCRHCHSDKHNIPTVRDELRASDWRSAGEILPRAVAQMGKQL